MKACLVVVLALLFADEKPAEKEETDQAKLQGTWAIVSVSFNGEQTPARKLKNRQLVFGEKVFTAYTNKKKGNSVRYALDPSKKPKHIDLRRDGVDKPALGIYELRGDKLKLCYGEPGAERPTEFTSKEGSRQFLMELERKKP